MLFDYSECIVHRETFDEFSALCHGYFIQRNPEDRGVTILPDLACKYEDFYNSKKWCKTCKDSELIKLMDHYKSPTTEEPCFLYFIHEYWVCPQCGWWILNEGKGETQPLEKGIRQIRFGLLKSFKEQDINLPLSVLENELNKRKEILYHIHPSKFEQLVSSILSDFFNCDVEICGKTGDGGIDLIVVNKDKPIAVQVKRRTKPESVELVSEIREFLAAAMLSDFRSAIFVSTASRFSREAQKTAQKAQQKGLIQKFELFDMNKFLEIYKITKFSDPQKYSPAWINYLAEELREPVLESFRYMYDTITHSY